MARNLAPIGYEGVNSPPQNPWNMLPIANYHWFRALLLNEHLVPSLVLRAVHALCRNAPLPKHLDSGDAKSRNIKQEDRISIRFQATICATNELILRRWCSEANSNSSTALYQFSAIHHYPG